MNPLLVGLAAIELVVLVLLAGVLTWLVLRDRRDLALIEQTDSVRAAILRDLVNGRHTDPAPLRALPLRWRAETLVALAGAVGPHERVALRVLAEECGVAAQARQRVMLRSRSARIAGLRVMTALGINDTAAFALLEDPRASVRSTAVWWLAVTGGDEFGARWVSRYADDPDPRVRHMVAEGLIACGSAAAVPVARMIDHGSAVARITALEAAAGLRDPEVGVAVNAVLGDRDPAVRLLAARAAASAGDPETRSRLAELLADAEPRVRVAAAWSLGRCRRPEDAVRLGPLLHDSDCYVRNSAAHALLQLGPVGEIAVRSVARQLVVQVGAA